MRSAPRNMLLFEAQAQVDKEYLTKERCTKSLIRACHDVQGLHISHVGIVPKGHTPEKWRVITDLSHPPGASVNNGINPAFRSLPYMTVDKIERTVAALGKGTPMAKVDIEAAYRLVPIHPDDHPLLAVRWYDETLCDRSLPFGLHSAPKIFNVVVDVLEWHIRRLDVSLIHHYLDDFIVMGPPSSSQCQRDLQLLEEECHKLELPSAEPKLIGPTTCLTFLGIEISTLAGSLRLPEEKLQWLIHTLNGWGGQKVCTRRQL